MDDVATHGEQTSNVPEEFMAAGHRGCNAALEPLSEIFRAWSHPWLQNLQIGITAHSDIGAESVFARSASYGIELGTYFWRKMIGHSTLEEYSDISQVMVVAHNMG